MRSKLGKEDLPRPHLVVLARHSLEEEQGLGAGRELERENDLDDSAKQTDEESNDRGEDAADELEDDRDERSENSADK